LLITVIEAPRFWIFELIRVPTGVGGEVTLSFETSTWKGVNVMASSSPAGLAGWVVAVLEALARDRHLRDQQAGRKRGIRI